MGFRSIITNLRKRGLKDVTNPDKVKAYLQGGDIERNGIHIPLEEIESYAEQIIYRRAMCPDCFSSDKCSHCGCKMPVSGYTPVNFCSAGNWDKMLSPEDWKKFKKDNLIEIGIKL